MLMYISSGHWWHFSLALTSCPRNRMKITQSNFFSHMPLYIFLIFSTYRFSVSHCPPPPPASPIPRSRSGSYLAATPYLIHCASQRKSFPLSGLFTLATIHAAAHSAPEYIPRRPPWSYQPWWWWQFLGLAGRGALLDQPRSRFPIRRCDTNTSTRP